MRVHHRGGGDQAAPVELRFIDLFMLIVAALVFVAVVAILVVAAPAKRGPLEIRNQSLPPASAGLPYEIDLAGSGGQPPYRWTLVGQTLPRGLQFDEAAGRIHGTPNTQGVTKVGIVLQDIVDRTTRAQLTLAVRANAGAQPLRIISPGVLLPEARTYVSYTEALSAAEGVSPYAYRLVAGDLPPGIRLTDDGTLKGRIELEAYDQRFKPLWRFSVGVTDAEGHHAEQAYVLPVRFQARYGWLSATGKLVVSAVRTIMRWLVVPLLAMAGIAVALKAVAGCRGGVATERRGLIGRMP
jgi:hypothetical protein